MEKKLVKDFLSLVEELKRLNPNAGIEHYLEYTDCIISKVHPDNLVLPLGFEHTLNEGINNQKTSDLPYVYAYVYIYGEERDVDCKVK